MPMTTSLARRPTCSRVALAVLALALATTAGCGDALSAHRGACLTDADCSAGLTCFEQTWCVADPDEARPVTLQLAPPPGAGAVLEHFDTMLGGPGGQAGHTYQLAQPAALRGTVTRADDPLTPSVPGRLIALSAGKITGTALRYEATSFATLKIFPGSGVVAGFEMRVQAGPHYDVAFWPDNHEIPPWFDGWQVAGSADDWRIELPSAMSLMRVRGRFRYGPSQDPDCGTATAAARPACSGTCVGVAGMRVLLRDATRRQRSSSAITDAEGRFELLIDAAAGEVEVAFSPHDPATPAPSGQLRQRIDLTTLRKKEQMEVEFGDLILGEGLSLVEAQVPVLDAQGLPVIGARVTAQRAFASTQSCALSAEGKVVQQPLFEDLRLSAEGHTDVEGKAKLQVVAGPWHLSVTPPVTSAAARATVGPVALSSGTTAAIACDVRRTFTGQLVGPDHVPMVNVRLRIGAIQSDSGESAATVVEALTDAGGAFHARLDPGRYAIVAEPPADAGVARALLRVIEVEADHDLPAQKLVMPAPAVLVGRVLAPDGSPLNGVVVDVLAPSLTSLSSLGDTRGTAGWGLALLAAETQRLATTVTDHEGRFRVLVATGQVNTAD